MHSTIKAWFVAALLAAGAPALAAPPANWSPVAAGTLDKMRGGFDTANGLAMSIGIERVVSVNGDVLSRNTLQIADVASLSREQAVAAQDALGAARVIQIGANNFVADRAGLPSGATLVQNSLNDQSIRAQTVITSTVNSMSMLKDLNFQGSVRDALQRSVGNL